MDASCLRYTCSLEMWKHVSIRILCMHQLRMIIVHYFNKHKFSELISFCKLQNEMSLLYLFNTFFGLSFFQSLKEYRVRATDQIHWQVGWLSFLYSPSGILATV